MLYMVVMDVNTANVLSDDASLDIFPPCSDPLLPFWLHTGDPTSALPPSLCLPAASRNSQVGALPSSQQDQNNIYSGLYRSDPHQLDRLSSILCLPASHLSSSSLILATSLAFTV